MIRILCFIVPLFGLIIPAASRAQDTPVQAVATTTLIADVARNVSGDLADVVALIPPDSDTHAFQPTPQDAVVIADADVMLVNGGDLEEGLLQLVETAATVPVTTVSDGVTMRYFGVHEDEAEGCIPEAHDENVQEADEDDHDADADDHAGEAHGHDHAHGACDPHVWGDPGNVAMWAENIAAALATVDPANAETYLANATAYSDELATLDAELEALFAPIPESRRILVTNHDFLSYFAARYGFEVIGTILSSASTLAEPTPQDVAALIERIKEYDVSAIFAEVADSEALAVTIADEVGDIRDVQVVTLYSGSLSASDGPAGTYLDYMRFNAQAIADALTE